MSPLSSGGLLLHVDLATRLARSVGLWLDVYHVLLAHSPNLISDARTTPAPGWLRLTVDSGLGILLVHDLAIVASTGYGNLDDGGGSIVHDRGPSSHQIHSRWKHGHSLTTADDPGTVADSLEDDRLPHMTSSTPSTNRDYDISNHLLLLLGLGDGLLHKLINQLLRGSTHRRDTFLCLRRSGLQAAGLGNVPRASVLSLGNPLQWLSLDPPRHALLGSRAFAGPLASNHLSLLPLVSSNYVIKRHLQFAAGHFDFGLWF